MKPGAILASNSDSPAQPAPFKKKRECKPLGKGQSGERSKVPKKALPRKPKVYKAEKPKSKSKKGKEYQVSSYLYKVVSNKCRYLLLFADNLREALLII